MTFSLRKISIIGGVVVVVGIVAILLLLNNSHKNDPSYTKEYIDKDTGETVSIQPNKTPEDYNSSKNITVLGLPSIAQLGSVSLTENQLPLLRQDLIDKALPTLGAHDDLVKITDISYDSNRDLVVGKFRYKEDKDSLAIEISVTSVYEFKYSLLRNKSVLYGSSPVVSTNELSGPDQAPE